MDAKIVKEPEQHEIEYMIGAAFPGRSWETYSLTMLKGGIFNTTYFVEPVPYEGKKYILRVGPVHRELLLPYEHYLMDSECWAYEKMAEAGIPTSTVVYKDTTKTRLDRDFMVVEYIESRELSRSQLTEEETYRVYYETGRYCRRMTEITGEKFGRVGYILRGKGYDTWGEYIKSELTEWADSVRANAAGYYTEEELCAIVSLADRYRDILDEVKTPRFNHCDMWRLNVLLDKDGKPEVAAIIDPDRCCMGDPDFELSSGWMMNDAFYDGYGRRMAEDEHTRIRTDIYKMIFLLLNGYFVRTQYEDGGYSEDDRKNALVYLNRLTGGVNP